ncbi:uncharacterized protein LOC115782616 [Archocentrus centrarchus]|uniref:uncharacterized protein LOC115782616 n=1 Tax=Archocentrus centrarchus TaxID=63155 RepID=UPI0011E9C035|nr:uncharacterized protein LOC115782616 [Archocentrus centrarchus]
MKVCLILFCFIFLTAQEDGNSGRVSAETSIHRVEGQDVTFECKFRISGSTKFFYKGGCENGNILIRTTDDTFQRGRYSMKYVKGTFISDIMSVKITQLKTSDSGQYCCTLDKTWSPDYFELIVTEALSTTTQSVKFSSAGSTPSSASTELVEQPETLAGSGPGELLYMIPVLVVMIILLSAALLIFYKKKKKNSQPKGPPVEPEYGNINRPSSSPAVEVSTVYAFPKSRQQSRAENLELYSLATSPQNKAEEEMNEVNYAAVDFSHIPATNSAPCGQTADVVYSTPRMDASPAHQVTDVCPPLYSTVRTQ